MVTPTPLIAAAAHRLQHRTFRDADGIRMVSQDGKRAVWLTPEQHHDLLKVFADAMRPINRRTQWGFILSIPVTILTLGEVHVLGLDRIVDNLALPGAALVSSVLILTWWPLLVVAYHWAATRRTNSRIESRLSSLPAAPLPANRPVGFQALEIVSLFIVGPGLIIDVIGSLFPHAFDHTPMMGRGMGPLSIAGLVVFGMLAGRRLLNRRPIEEPASCVPATSEPVTTDRRAKIAARAREQAALD